MCTSIRDVSALEVEKRGDNSSARYRSISPAMMAPRALGVSGFIESRYCSAARSAAAVFGRSVKVPSSIRMRFPVTGSVNRIVQTAGPRFFERSSTVPNW
jgi:hypothetical protein